MSNPVVFPPTAAYGFLPWVRQGAGRYISQTDNLAGTSNASVLGRPAISVSLRLDTVSATGTVSPVAINKDISFIGPGDILGINKAMVIRTTPQVDVYNFEPNYLASIEFYEEDFLWKYSPALASSVNLNTVITQNTNSATANNKNKLRPWLTLLVLKEENNDIKEYSLFPPSEKNVLPYIEVTADVATVLPPAGELWAWAHVHLMQDQASLNNNNANALAFITTPDGMQQAVSRLLCPRRLEPGVVYSAFLIPSFETGRLAGLGADDTAINLVEAQESSWQHNSSYSPPAGCEINKYPVYYQWKFGTGLLGDFETLVRILKPLTAAPTNGVQALDISNIGFNLHPGTSTVSVEGAIVPALYNFPPHWGNEQHTIDPGNDDDADFVEDLKEILNLNGQYTSGSISAAHPFRDTTINPFYSWELNNDPMVLPPIYGQWHALENVIDAGTSPPWLKTVNLDPRYRAVAGLGAQVIRENQDKFMEIVWQQIGEVNEANDKIRKAELAKFTAETMYRKHLKYDYDDHVLRNAAPILKKIVGISASAISEISNTRIGFAPIDGAFKKLTRNLSQKVKKCQVQSGQMNGAMIPGVSPNPLNQSIIGNVNSGQIVVADTKSSPPTATGLFTGTQNIKDLITNANSSSGSYSFFSTGSGSDLNDAVQAVLQSSNVLNGGTSTTYTAISGQTNNTPSAGFAITGAAFNVSSTLAADAVELQSDSMVNIMTTYMAQNLATPKTPLDIENLVAPSNGSLTLRQKLSPGTRIDARLVRQFLDPQQGVGQLAQVVKPIMFYPTIKEAMFKYLMAISIDYIVPNLSTYPQNTISLMQMNKKFIEAFMLGLNHEMSKELLWNEYPTDMRGTYFKQFWDVRDTYNAATNNTPDFLPDIAPIDEWADNALGSNNDPRLGDDSHVVLFVRSDLLKKYPNTIIYAQQAEFYIDNADNVQKRRPKADDASNMKFPVFKLEIDPDIVVLSFELTVPQVKGVDGIDPGWFFVFRERPGQIQFGLDEFDGTVLPNFPNLNASTGNLLAENVKTGWNTLTWGHLDSASQPSNSAVKVLKVSGPYSSSLDGFLSQLAGKVNQGVIPIAQTWANNSAIMASILLQDPVVAARHADDML